MTTQIWLQQLMVTRQVSIKRLSLLLGYKSPTSLARILHAKANSDSIQQLAERIRLCDQIELTSREQRQLNAAVKMDLLGADQYFSNLEMEKLLKGLPANEGHIRVCNVADGSTCDLETLYRQAADIRMVLYNCHNAPIYPWLSTLLSENGASIRHIIVPAADARDAIHAINAISEVAFYPRYEGYVLKAETMAAWPSKGLAGSDALFCSYRDQNGTAWEDFITLIGENQALRRTEVAASLSFAPFFELDLQRCESIKRTFPQCKSFPDYLEFIRQFSALETDRNTYRLKPDICVDIIPTHILKAAGLGGNLPKVEGFDALIDAFEVLFSQRIHNVFTKHRVTHLVMKRAAMRNFTQSGFATDHFWGFRPYTREERIEIYETLIDHQQHNPYFHLNFLKDDSFVRDAEIGYYEGLGMLFLPTHTPYDLHDRYAEVMITQTDFCERFKNYYLQTILRNEVISPQETLAFLREQVQKLKTK